MPARNADCRTDRTEAGQPRGAAAGLELEASQPRKAPSM